MRLLLRLPSTDLINQYFHVLWWRINDDTMSKVEYERTSPERPKYVRRLQSQLRAPNCEDLRIKVALNTSGGTSLDAPCCPCDRNGFLQAHCIHVSGFGISLAHQACATRKPDDRNDDIVIRTAGDGAGTRIDMRSTSRQGHSDYGINAAIRAFMSALRIRIG